MENAMLNDLEMSDNDLAIELYQHIIKNQLNDARVLLEKLSEKDRKSVVAKHLKIDPNPPLFLAVTKGDSEFVRFLVEECYADLEEHGIYQVEEDKSEHIVSPLWCAAVANQIEVVRVLTSLGADVNATSDTGSTPIRSACFMTNIEVVQFLAENGADLDKANVNGGTCLINSVQNVDLCKFLIDKGVNVNVHDSSGNLALHYAIKEGRFETVQLLVDCGSDPYVRNEYGDNALLCASLKGFLDIVEYLIEKLKPSIEEQIEAYQLLGGNFIDERQDVERALLMWRKAMELRLSNPHAESSEQRKVLKPNAAYGYAKEARSSRELQEIGQNRDLVFMQALLLRETILGPSHKDTIFGLMYRGAVYADAREYGRCIALWKYAFKLRHETHELLTHEYLFTLQALCKLFWEIYDEDYSRNMINYIDIFQVLEMAAREAEAVKILVETSAISDAQNEKLLCLMQLLLHLLHLLTKLPKDESRTLEFKKMVHHLVRIQLKSSDNKSLLLLAVNKDTSYVSEEFYSHFPSSAVVGVLLECGADVHEIDKNANTALHLSADDQRNLRNPDEVKQVIDLLLRYGAHVDAKNDSGEIAALHLLSSGSKFSLLDYQDLRCLAATAIRKYDLRYKGIVPTSLYNFIQMH